MLHEVGVRPAAGRSASQTPGCAATAADQEARDVADPAPIAPNRPRERKGEQDPDHQGARSEPLGTREREPCRTTRAPRQVRAPRDMCSEAWSTTIGPCASRARRGERVRQLVETSASSERIVRARRKPGST